MPGMSASVSRSILVMENPEPSFSSVTFASVWMRFGAMRALERRATTAIVKHPAWAAPSNSSGLVADWPSSNRDLNEFGPSKAPLPTFNRPLPSARLPFQRLSLAMFSAASSVAGMTSQVIAGGRRALYIGDRPRSLKRPNERSIPMSNVNELVVNYLAAWNERDAKRRRDLMAHRACPHRTG